MTAAEQVLSRIAPVLRPYVGAARPDSDALVDDARSAVDAMTATTTLTFELDDPTDDKRQTLDALAALAASLDALDPIVPILRVRLEQSLFAQFQSSRRLARDHVRELRIALAWFLGEDTMLAELGWTEPEDDLQPGAFAAERAARRPPRVGFG